MFIVFSVLFPFTSSTPIAVQACNCIYISVFFGTHLHQLLLYLTIDLVQRCGFWQKQGCRQVFVLSKFFVCGPRMTGKVAYLNEAFTQPNKTIEV